MKKFVYLPIMALLLLTAISAQNASAQNPFFPKPDLVITHIKAPLEAHPGDELGGRVELSIVNNGIAPAEGGYRIDFFISSDRKLPRGIQPGPSDVFVEDALMEGGRTPSLPGLAQEETYHFTQQRLKLPDSMPFRTYHVCAFMDPDDVIEEEDSRSLYLCAPMHIIPGGNASTPVEEPISSPPPTFSPPRSISATDLRDYDENRDCLLDDAEFFNVVDDWTSQSARDEIFFGGIDAWMSQTNICRTSSASTALNIEMRANSMLFTTANQSLSQISVYDIQGREVFSSHGFSQQLHWNLRDTRGAQVPNGVYFASFKDSAALTKFVVLR